MSREWAERPLSWRHTGFNVHSRVRARTKSEAERVEKYMIRPLLSLERLSFSEKEGKVSAVPMKKFPPWFLTLIRGEDSIFSMGKYQENEGGRT